MKAQRRLGLDLSWPRITGVFVIDVAVLALVSNVPESWQTQHIAWWVGVAVAVVVALVTLVTYRRVPLASALAGRVLGRFTDPELMLEAGRTPAIDQQRRFGRHVVGVRQYRGRLVAVVAVDGPDDANRGRHRQSEVSSPRLPLDAVAAGLREFDVLLDSIDVVSVGTRHSSAWGDAAAWDRPESANQNAAPERRTWLVIRMDPQRNASAIAARDSVASTLAAVAERLAHSLEMRRCPARPLTADEFDELDNAVLAGLEPAQILPRPRRLKHKQPKGFVTSFWVSPRDITSETLQELWQPDTDATVVTIRLTPGRRGPEEVSAWVRYHSERPRTKEWRGLNRLTGPGRQLAAVCASLPTPVRRPRLVVPTRQWRDDEELMVQVGSAVEYPMAPAGG